MKKKVITLHPDEAMNTKDGKGWYGNSARWSVSVYQKTETDVGQSMKYWVYNGSVQVGAHGPTIKKAMENLRQVMLQHIKKCTDIMAELDGISEFKLEDNIEAKED